MNLPGQEVGPSTLLTLYITVCTYILDLVLNIKDKGSQESNTKEALSSFEGGRNIRIILN